MMEQLYLTQWKLTAALSAPIATQTVLTFSSHRLEPIPLQAVFFQALSSVLSAVTVLCIFSMSNLLSAGFAIIHYISKFYNTLEKKKSTFPLDQVAHDKEANSFLAVRFFHLILC